MTEYKTIEARCHCEGARVVVKVPRASLPLKMGICHCETCRRVTGFMAYTFIDLPKDHQIVQVTGPVEKYRTSEHLERGFCTKCGATLYEDTDDLVGRNRGIMPAALTEFDGVVDPVPAYHAFVSDTKDGGLRDWLRTYPSFEITRFQSAEIPPNKLYNADAYKRLDDSDYAGQQDKVKCACHCGGVTFWITRPNRDSFDPVKAAGRPDAVRGDRFEMPPEMGTWFADANSHRYRAILCGCNFCRQCSGQSMTAWAFVPLSNIVDAAGKPVNIYDGSSLPTLRRYNSSRKCFHDFCATCGANVFWRDETVRPGVYDVSVGLLQAPSGVRAHEWIDWIPHTCHEDSAQNPKLFDDINAGLRAWACAAGP